MELSRLLPQDLEDHAQLSPIEDGTEGDNSHVLPVSRKNLRLYRGSKLLSRTWLFEMLDKLHPSQRPAWRIRLATRPQSCARKAVQCLLWTIATFIFVSLLNGIFNPSYGDPPQRYHALSDLVSESTTSGRGNKNNEKIFIAANIIDENLIKAHWGQALLELVDILGQDNVFISIYENDSGLGTSQALQELQGKFSCLSHVSQCHEKISTNFGQATLRLLQAAIYLFRPFQ